MQRVLRFKEIRSMLINFDYDGVIVDSFEQLLDLSVRAQQSLGVGRVPTRDDFRTIENLTIYDLGKLIGLPEDLASGYANEIFKLQKENWDVNVFPDIGESGVSQTTRRVSDKLKNDKKPTRKINRIKNKLNL